MSATGMVTLDAHHDVRDGMSNGSPVARLVESGMDGRAIVQIGISDFANSREYAARARAYRKMYFDHLSPLKRKMLIAKSEKLRKRG